MDDQSTAKEATLKTVQKLTAKQRRYFTRIVEAGAGSLRQSDIARATGISASTVCRVMRTREATEAIAEIRARAFAESWSQFEELLQLSITHLRAALVSPLTPYNIKARIALSILQTGLANGVPNEGGGLTINLPPAADSGDERRNASGHRDTVEAVDTDTDAGEVFPVAQDTDKDATGLSGGHSGTKSLMPMG